MNKSTVDKVFKSSVFQERFNKLIKDRGLNQEKVSEGVGVTRQAISLYSTGKRTPDISTLWKICDYFNVSADFMLGINNVKSSNIDNKEINKRLGLSEESIMILECINSTHTKKNLLMVINFLLEQEGNSLFKINNSYVSIDDLTEKMMIETVEEYIENRDDRKALLSLNPPIISIIAKYFNVKFDDRQCFEIDGNVIEDNEIIKNPHPLNKKLKTSLGSVNIGGNDLIDYIYLKGINEDIKLLKEKYIKNLENLKDI